MSIIFTIYFLPKISQKILAIDLLHSHDLATNLQDLTVCPKKIYSFGLIQRSEFSSNQWPISFKIFLDS